MVSFFALTIMGLGVLSLFAEHDIISVPRLGQLPGVVGMVLAVLVFALALWVVLADARPSFVATVFLALGAALVHLGGVWGAAVAEGAGAVGATAAAGQLVLGGASAVIVVAALLAGWVAIALRRTAARAPHWPWEKDDDDV
ncbi:hypothetical protein RL72_01214 [Microbacterium azadirachtae]|uniref:Tryptophan-associated transmembrane protein (Trp_oprn_chp) n=1 Tax=Microbacterium azadirachtae TaxID=582680 RepID=A0A0F0L0U9_9MICO|nr:hypothetical protein RL72_01214 [Microbacterium azadirachtae]SDM44669.1 hypothetical protein SAMN04488593_3581 [Microbacterium azadirachtae]SEG56411.1 hypothetical protein SAMN04488594_3508 [Microbacterium azadirachtae]SEG59244.1 hypothetical protein SAMN04488592_3519 [Microbacterium azadirachtae]